MRVEFERTFAAAHRIWNDASHCNRIHGHNYRCSVRVETFGSLTEQNFVVPWDAVKGVIDAFDHRLILDRDDWVAGLELPGALLIDGPPSTERLASLLAYGIAAGTRRAGVTGVVVVRLAETDALAATAEVAL